MTDAYTPDVDFNTEEEFKPTPLVANGHYKGNVIETNYEKTSGCIVWKVSLNDNGGVMSDDETPIDGSHHYYRVSIPRAGEKDKMTKDGKQTIHQAKINMMKQFSDKMGISLASPEVISEALQNQEWVGLAVIAELEINEWEGRVSNRIKNLAPDNT